MGLLQNLLGGNRVTGQPQSYGMRDYVDVLMGDVLYDTAAEVIALIGAAAHADFRKIWELSVPAQQRLAWGFGSAGLPHNQGYMWFCSVDSATDFDVGILRLQQCKANDYGTIVVAQIPDGNLHTATNTTAYAARPTDRNTMIALPEKVEYPLIGEDSKLQLTYALRTAATTHDDCDMGIPITRYQ